MSNGEIKAIHQGLVEELNLRWYLTGFYAYEDDGVILIHGALAGTRLKILVSGSAITVQKLADDGRWRGTHKFGLLEPHSLDRLYACVNNELI